MKKVFLILLTVVYAISGFGICVKEFYCCGKLKTTTISFADAGVQKCSNANNMKGCCKTKYHILKLNENHIPGDALTAPSVFFSDVSLPALCDYTYNKTAVTITVSNAVHAPPILDPVHIYIKNCCFLL
jgi:hypothetical protein